MSKQELFNSMLNEDSEEARHWRLTSQDAAAVHWRRVSTDQDAVDWRKANKERALAKGGVRNARKRSIGWPFILLGMASIILIVTAFPLGLALAGFTLYLKARKQTPPTQIR